MKVTYEYFVSDAGSPYLFKYHVVLYRRTPKGDRVRVAAAYRDLVWSCRCWAKRQARRDRRRQANGGYVARGTT